MKKWYRDFVLAVLTVTITWAVPNILAGDLSVATGQIEITGPQGYPMGGYGARNGVNQGVHDSLMAKVLLIKSGNQEIGIVTLDLLSFSSERVAQVARDQLGIEPLLLVCSHTHSGPVAVDREHADEDPWVVEVEEKILKLLSQAQNSFVPARMAVTSTRLQIGHNRRRLTPDGQVEMFWRNAERIPTSPVDPTAGIVQFVADSGEVLAVLVNYACHAVVLGPDNLLYSADFPGFMYRYVEKALGSPAVCYFIPGASGDINPYNDKQPVSDGGFEVAQKAGEVLGGAVVEALGRMSAAPKKISVKASLVDYRLKRRFTPEDELPISVVHILLGEETVILAIPAEVFVSHQIDFKARSPLPNTFLFGNSYAGKGEFAGYIPTIREAMEGGYGASYATKIEVGAGERIIDQGLVWIYEQLGLLRDVPDM